MSICAHLAIYVDIKGPIYALRFIIAKEAITASVICNGK
jgi:hypothetical protein